MHKNLSDFFFPQLYEFFWDYDSTFAYRPRPACKLCDLVAFNLSSWWLFVL